MDWNKPVPFHAIRSRLQGKSTWDHTFATIRYFWALLAKTTTDVIDLIIIVDDISLNNGGCACNTAVALGKLGIDTAVIGKVGCDTFGD